MSRTPELAFAAFPCRVLERPLSAALRARLSRVLAEMVASHEEGRALPDVSAVEVPDATPFVSLYRSGRAVGCFGSSEPSPKRRLADAFTRAATDPRFAPASDGELRAQVSFPRAPKLLNPHVAADEIEVGLHGVALAPRGRAPALLLPEVARDHGLGPRELLGVLCEKAGVPRGELDGALYRFEVDRVLTASIPKSGASPVSLARAWLAGLVGEDGAVAFGRDPRTGTKIEGGLMHHARVAVALRALATSPRHRAELDRGRAWLRASVARGLARGREQVAAWPVDPAAVGGTLALALLAGLDCERDLVTHVAAHGDAIRREPWYAAQAIVACPSLAPLLLPACEADLARRPWAPWTVIAASAAGDRKLATRAGRPIADAVRRSAPHLGGVCGPSGTAVPEIALTAVSVEALATLRAPWARAAMVRARSFLTEAQLLGSRIYAALDLRASVGAFPASPAADLLRADIVGHAVLALA